MHEQLLIQLTAFFAQVIKHFPPTPCFVQRLHAKPPAFREGTLDPSFVYTIVPSLLTKTVVIKNKMSPCSIGQGL